MMGSWWNFGELNRANFFSLSCQTVDSRNNFVGKWANGVSSWIEHNTHQWTNYTLCTICWHEEKEKKWARLQKAWLFTVHLLQWSSHGQHGSQYLTLTFPTSPPFFLPSTANSYYENPRRKCVTNDESNLFLTCIDAQNTSGIACVRKRVTQCWNNAEINQKIQNHTTSFHFFYCVIVGVLARQPTKGYPR
jgi:hypothetical protein